MQYIHVKGAKVPALGFGTFSLHGDDGVRLIRCALEAGYRHIDTAEEYGTEGEVGQAVRQSGVAREQLFLVTKIRRENLARDAVRSSLEASLRRLGTDYVDLLLIHWPNHEVPLGETLEALAELRAAGKTRFLGVSNFTVPLLLEAIDHHGAELLTNQVEYHVFLAQDDLLDYLRSQGMMLTAHSPLAGGAAPMRFNLAGVARARGRVVNRVGGRYGRSVSRFVYHWIFRSSQGNALRRPAAPHHPELARIGERYGKSAAQVALRWLIEQDGVSAIPRAGTEQECRDNLDIFDFTLSDDDREAIVDLAMGFRVCDPAHAPAWQAGAGSLPPPARVSRPRVGAHANIPSQG